MTQKKEDNSPKGASEQKEEEDLRKLMEKHPYETMSQVQNRYGEGREQNGKEGSEKGANRLDH